MIKEPRLRSSRWISTSIPPSEWESPLAMYSSADYHVNNLVSPVLFHEGLSLVPENAVVVEIAPHALLQVHKQLLFFLAYPISHIMKTLMLIIVDIF